MSRDSLNSPKQSKIRHPESRILLDTRTPCRYRCGQRLRGSGCGITGAHQNGTAVFPGLPGPVAGTAEEAACPRLSSYDIRPFVLGPQLVGASASECDTIPGRQCMASCFFLLKQFEDVNIYLNSVKVHPGGLSRLLRFPLLRVPLWDLGAIDCLIICRSPFPRPSCCTPPAHFAIRATMRSLC